MQTEMLLSLPFLVASHSTSCLPGSAILLSFSLFFVALVCTPLLFVYKDFQRFSWNCRCLGLHLQNTSCSKLRDKFGNWRYLITTLWQNQEWDGGILRGYFAISHRRQGVHTRQCSWGARETSLSENGIFWVTSVNYSDIQCYSNTHLIWWHLHCNIKTIPRHLKCNHSADGVQKHQNSLSTRKLCLNKKNVKNSLLPSVATLVKSREDMI